MTTYQFCFLPSCQLFDVIFSAHCLLLCFKFLIIDELDRTSCSGIFCCCSRVMSGKAFFEIICPTAVKRIVGTSEDISVVTHLLSSLIIQQPSIVIPLAVHFFVFCFRNQPRERFLILLGVSVLVKANVITAHSLIQRRKAFIL